MRLKTVQERKNDLGIKSPSKEFTKRSNEFWGIVMEGFIEGLNSESKLDEETRDKIRKRMDENYH